MQVGAHAMITHAGLQFRLDGSRDEVILASQLLDSRASTAQDYRNWEFIKGGIKARPMTP